MNGDPLSSALSILTVVLYSLCAIATFYCLLAGFYLVMNPENYNIFNYFRDHWKRVLLTTLPIVVIFWFTASYAAVYCKVTVDSYTTQTGYYFHKMSLFLPKCGNVGAWAYGELPPRSVPGLTFPGNTPDAERVILKKSLAIYLALISLIISWVGNYVLKVSLEKRNQKPAEDN